MTATRPVDLYALLPTVYRLRDAEQGEPLRALLGLISEQAELVRQDLDGLWDDFFVETAADWVLPYLGDLVGTTPIYDVPGVGRRADVANTVAWRRRKGTLSMLDHMAHDVTGWGAHAFATFELLAWNQHLTHLRRTPSGDPFGRIPAVADPRYRPPRADVRVGTVDARVRDAVDRIGGAFEVATHLADLRAIDDSVGWYGIRKLPVFVMRLRAFQIAHLTPSRAPGPSSRCLHLHPLGQDAPLFHIGEPVTDELALADERSVDAAMRPLHVYADPSVEVGPGRSLALWRADGTPIAAADILPKDLGGWPAVPADKVALDVVRGRIRLGANFEPAGLTADVTAGFSAPIGGGAYPRTPRSEPEQATLTLHVAAAGGAGVHPTIELAIAAWTATSPRVALRLVIDDSATYRPSPPTLTFTGATAGAPLDVELLAADGRRPVIVGDLLFDGGAGPAGGLDQVTVDGIVLSGQVQVTGTVHGITLVDTTLVPGIGLTEGGEATLPARESLNLDAPRGRREIHLTRCITGPIRGAAEGNIVCAADSSIDAPPQADGAPRIAYSANAAGTAPGPELTLERCTVLGAVNARALALVSESIVARGTLVAERRQIGCVRLSSYERATSRPPRRFHCQPDLVRAAAPDPASADAEELRVTASFTSTRYGQPGYLQLQRGGPSELARGAGNGAEMGVFHQLLQPQRESNLRIRLQESMPFGLEPGIVRIT